MTVTNIYADVAHVQAHLNSLGGPGITIGVASVPTTSQVEGFLDQVAAEVDGILAGQGYGTIPASGTNDVLMLRRYIAQKVAAMVWMAGFMSDDLPGKVQRWLDEYDAFIARMLDKTQRLIDQTPRGKMGVVLMSRYIED